MKVFHLSHIDLDGYGAQYIAQHFFKEIVFFNANYGKEISVRLEEMLALAKKEEQKTLLLITDLNLTLLESTILQERVHELKISGHKIDLLLLDHHISGSESAEKFHWYYLDHTRSASKITFETLLSSYPLLDPKEESWLRDFAEMVNAVDTWLVHERYFEFGKVLMGAIAASKDPNRLMFEEQNREIKFALLRACKDYLYLPCAEVEFDNALFFLRKRLFGGDPQKETMDNIFASYLVRLLEDQKQNCQIFYQDKKGFLSYMLGSVSVIGNQFLCRNPDFDFFIDVNARGNVSLRANHACDVSALAQECFNGGGHKNAAGGKIEGFKESFLYEQIKAQVQTILEERIWEKKN